MTKTSTTLAALGLGVAATLASLPAHAGKEIPCPHCDRVHRTPPRAA